MRARSLQLRIHDAGHRRDCDDVPRRWGLHESMGRLGHVLLRALPAKFRSISGLELPRTRSPGPRKEAIHRLAQKRLFELWHLWDARIKAINPDASYIANAGGGALSELDMKTIGEIAPTLFADRQGRHGVAPPWENGKNGKEYRATLGRKAIAGIFSVGIEDENRWKDSVQNGDEIRLWVADGIANGLRPWFTKFNAKPIDRRWLPVVEELYSWHYQNERYLRNEDSLARVAMVYSQQTAEFYGGERAAPKWKIRRWASIRRWWKRVFLSRWFTTACSMPRTWTRSGL